MRRYAEQMTRDTFVVLEAARERVLAEAARFVEALELVLGGSLGAGFERLCIRQADHIARLDPQTRAALDKAIRRATGAGVTEACERLRSPEIWLSPLTAPGLRPRTVPAVRLGVPEWIARLGGSGGERLSLGALDDPSNRIWVAISSAAKPLDPVLEEFGFRPERKRIGGGSFGISARTLPQLDPSGALGQRWRRYRAAFERLSALAAADG